MYIIEERGREGEIKTERGEMKILFTANIIYQMQTYDVMHICPEPFNFWRRIKTERGEMKIIIHSLYHIQCHAHLRLFHGVLIGPKWLLSQYYVAICKQISFWESNLSMRDEKK